MEEYVLFLRVSTRQQGDSGLGLEAQQRDIDLFLNNYTDEPYEVIGKFIAIQSGSNTETPELWEAIDLAEKHRATLLVSKLDRLSRKVSFIASLMERKKLRFTVASMPHADKFQLHLYAALAEQEREFISMRTKQALAEAKKRGVKLGGDRGGLATQIHAHRRRPSQKTVQIPLGFAHRSYSFPRYKQQAQTKWIRS